MLLSLAEKQTTMEAWDTLKTMYMGAGRLKAHEVVEEVQAINKVVEEVVAHGTTITIVVKAMEEVVEEAMDEV